MKKLKFEPILVGRASEHIERKIKEAIIDGRLRPGFKLPTEKEMAEQFGVSVVTLREALTALQVFGVIEKKKGKGGGIFVAELDNDSIRKYLGHYLSFKNLSIKHLYDVRKIIEPPLLKLAAISINDEELKKLEQNVSDCEEMIRKAGSNFSEKEFFDLDQMNVDFHRIIAESTHNPILVLTVDYVFYFLGEVELKLMVPDLKFSQDTIREHRAILESLKERDSQRCEKEIMIHLEHLDRYLLDMEEGLHEKLISSRIKESIRGKR